MNRYLPGRFEARSFDTGNPINFQLPAESNMVAVAEAIDASLPRGQTINIKKHLESYLASVGVSCFNRYCLCVANTT